jgi:hypothetical protein
MFYNVIRVDGIDAATCSSLRDIPMPLALQEFFNFSKEAGLVLAEPGNAQAQP